MVLNQADDGCQAFNFSLPVLNFQIAPEKTIIGVQSREGQPRRFIQGHQSTLKVLWLQDKKQTDNTNLDKWHLSLCTVICQACFAYLYLSICKLSPDLSNTCSSARNLLCTAQFQTCFSLKLCSARLIFSSVDNGHWPVHNLLLLISLYSKVRNSLDSEVAIYLVNKSLRV